MGYREYEQMNWLPVEHRFQQNIATFAHNFFSGNSPDYISELFIPSTKKVRTRNSLHHLFKPSSKTNGQKGIAFLGPTVWNSLTTDMKSVKNRNTFKHKIKSKFFCDVQKQEQSLFL